MRRVRLIHWNAGEAKERAGRLRDAGYQVTCKLPAPPDFRRELTKAPPAAVVIDLERLPMQGRDVALTLRQSRVARHVPLVFVGGEPEKVERIRTVIPDAAYTSWSRIRGALKQAIAHPPADPVVPHSVLAGYSGTPLAKKLGIKANSTVALAGEPPGFRKVLGDLPEGAELREHTGAGDRERALRVAGEPGGLPAKPAGTDLTIWFARSREELWSGIKQMARVAGGQKLWIAWPKKASSIATDLTQQDVREAGLGAGLVDYKICAIDASWSGLLFTRRKPAAAGGR